MTPRPEWTPVEIRIFGNFREWYPAGVHCYLTNKDCVSCPVRLYGINLENGCKQPQAVQILLERLGPPPPSKIRYWEQTKAPVQ